MLWSANSLLLFYINAVANPEDAASVHPQRLFRDEISIVSSFVGPYTMDRALHLLAAGTVDPSVVLGDAVTLREAADWVVKSGPSRNAKVYAVF